MGVRLEDRAWSVEKLLKPTREFVLDFGVTTAEGVVLKSSWFPPGFVLLLSRIPLSLDVTIYDWQEEEIEMSPSDQDGCWPSDVGLHLEAWGKEFDIDAFLQTMGLEADDCSEDRRGCRVRLGPVAASHEEQQATARAFFAEHAARVDQARQTARADVVALDFGLTWPGEEAFASCQRWDADFLQFAARHGLGLRHSMGFVDPEDPQLCDASPDSTT